ncbi:acyl carrier protein [Ferrovibrio sp.]|uniref:acyl carrier protein n=1 Tax=Ferrovibrio sp. TaxID=1917215 RepID=UPI001B59A155|nr:acyl carrier protein [Ferrovibrio sp.]MBP7063126.1 acyl carrier protein [Ferrovibrio sp.]
MFSREMILEKLTGYLEDMFEVPRERITEAALLYEDLDLDSIDAVDLVVKLQELTGRKFKPEEFKTVRTVGDVLDRVHALVAE